MTDILIVGPKSGVAQELISGLIAEDISVNQVIDADTGVAFLDHDQPRIVLVHTDLPRSDTIRFHRYVESNYPTIPVLSLTEDEDGYCIDISGGGRSSEFPGESEGSDEGPLLPRNGAGIGREQPSSQPLIEDNDLREHLEAREGGYRAAPERNQPGVPVMNGGDVEGTIHLGREGGEFTLGELGHLVELEQASSRFPTALGEPGENRHRGSVADRAITASGLSAGLGSPIEGLDARGPTKADPEAEDRNDTGAATSESAEGDTAADATTAELEVRSDGSSSDPDAAGVEIRSDDSNDGGDRFGRPEIGNSERSNVHSGRRSSGSTSRGDDTAGRFSAGGSEGGNGGAGGGLFGGSKGGDGWGRIPFVVAAIVLILLLATFGAAAPGRYVPTHVNQEPVYCGSCHPAQVVELNQTSHLTYFTEKVNETYYNRSGEHLSSAESVSASCMLCHNYWNRRNRLYAQDFSLVVAQTNENTTVYNASYERIVPTSEVPNGTLTTTYVSTDETNYTRMDLVWENVSNVSPSRVQTESCGVAQRGLTCHAAVEGYAIARNGSMSEIPEASGGSAAFYRHSMMSPRWTGTNRKQITMCGACHFGKLPPSHASGVPKDREGNLTWTYSMNDTQTLTASYPEPNWAHSNVQCIDCHAHARELNASG